MLKLSKRLDLVDRALWTGRLEGGVLVAFAAVMLIWATRG